MLALPERGMTRSTNVHNVALDVLVDWVEGSALFDAEGVSQAAVVDMLCESQIYSSQDFAWERVSDAWGELRRRESCLQDAYPFVVGDEILESRGAWREATAYSFCLVLCFAKWYRDWARQFGHDFTEQGELFELMTRDSLSVQFSGWEFHLTGWSRSRVAQLAAIVSEVARMLGESMGNVRRWTRPQSHEAGLDILCYRPFRDRRVGVPVYLLQCASGGDWDGKLHTPRLETWTKIIDFAAAPRKAFATPFAFLDDEFIVNAGLVDGLLIDRVRLLAPGLPCQTWLSGDVRERVLVWLEPRIQLLPKASQTV